MIPSAQTTFNYHFLRRAKMVRAEGITNSPIPNLFLQKNPFSNKNAVQSQLLPSSESLTPFNYLKELLSTYICTILNITTLQIPILVPNYKDKMSGYKVALTKCIDISWCCCQLGILQLYGSTKVSYYILLKVLVPDNPAS